jgi:phosphatidate cytidylyltransferase
MAGLVGIAVMVVPRYVSVATVAALSMLWWAYAFAGILRFPVPIGRPAALVSGVLVLLPAWVALVELLYTSVDGRKLLLLALATVWAADVGAYFAGRRYGRVKLAPRVSPGKTWEGVIGGIVCAALAAAAGAAILGHAVAPALPLGMSVAAISVVGDLTVSMFKRNRGLKDSGNLFPGHGGVLDRVDSVTAAAPLFVLEAGWLGWLSA